GFAATRDAYRGLLVRLLSRQGAFIATFFGSCLLAWFLLPWLGENFFPASDNGQFILHARAKTGTRIEETARLADLLEAAIRQEIPEGELDNIIDNIGMPYSTINTIYSRSGFIGSADADILVTLRKGHQPTENHVRALRRRLPDEFPGVIFYFVPADIVTQILNFGLPAPIDVQIEGNNFEGNRQAANKMMAELRQVPGLTDLRVHQTFDSPKLEVSVDRSKAAGAGFTPRDVANSVLLTLSGSGQVNPATFLNWKNGVSYNLVTQAPQYSVESLQDLQNIPLGAATATSRPAADPGRPGLDRARKHHGGDLPLQRPPGDRHLWLGAGPGPGRGRARHHPDHRRQPSAPAARELRDAAGTGRDHAQLLPGAAGRTRLRD